MHILLWPGYDTLARGPVSKGHYCSDKECGLYPMGKSRVRWFTRECYLRAGVKAQEESPWEAGMIELAINKQLVCLIPGDLKRSLMKCLSAQLTWGGWREKLLSVSHLPLIGGSSAFSDWAYLTARWVPLGTSRSSVGQRGLEGSVRLSIYEAGQILHGTRLPSQWREYEVSLRGFEAEHKKRWT